MFDLIKIQSETVFNIDEFLKNSGQDVVLVGLEGHGVRVEVDISSGLPLFESVGQFI
ncbi:hypothetical protein [Neomoorella thermoacetica]|uniref:hypothetical protein n=1 Tax=Neomoorella thermoacetica TaxID=1525 RepID=UPI0015D660AA|nr:hypothetical protein [Moorella thermoacetica]